MRAFTYKTFSDEFKFRAASNLDKTCVKLSDNGDAQLET